MGIEFFIFILVFICSNSCFAIEESAMFYIKPSPSAPCPEKSCLTLSQLIVNTTLKPNTTLTFLPGNYSLGTEISVKHLDNLAIFANSCTFICQRDASFKFENIGYLRISGFKFDGCGNNQALFVKDFVLDNCIFLGQKESGTALEVNETSLSVVNTAFVSNTVGSFRGPIGILEWINETSVYAYVGGAIIATQSNVTVINSKFVGNNAEIGGAIFATLDSSIVVINSTFVGNTVTNRSKDMFCYGGVLYSESGFFKTTQVAAGGCEFSNNTATYGVVFTALNCTVNVASSKFDNNIAEERGGVMWIQSGAVMTISDSEIANNTAQMNGGGVMYMRDSSSVIINMSQVYNNSALMSGGVVDTYKQCSVTIYGSIFWNNTAQQFGGAIAMSGASKINISESQFNGMSAKVGGVVFITADKLSLGDDMKQRAFVTIYCSQFWNNRVALYGGVIDVHNARVIVCKSQFHSNIATVQGGVLGSQSKHSIIIILSSVFKGNSAVFFGGVIMIMYAHNLTITRCRFISNKAHSGGVLNVARISMSLMDVEFTGNQGFTGGAIMSSQSDIFFSGECNLTQNAGFYGGAVGAVESTLKATDNIMLIENNTALKTGGGLYLYRSEVHCQHNSTIQLLGNTATEKGGGVHAINSFITIASEGDFGVESSIHFTENTAKWGGGVHLELTSVLYIVKVGMYYTVNTHNLYFTSNSADYGGAIHVDDRTNFETCSTSNDSEDGTSCFLQIVTIINVVDYHDLVGVIFTQNSACLGSILFGGLLDRCTLSGIAKRFVQPSNQKHIDGLTYFKYISNITNLSDSLTDSIHSFPVRLCFCRPGDKSNCSYVQPHPIRVKKGEMFNVSLVAVDQVNHTVNNVSIHSSLEYSKSGLGEGQMLQTTGDGCTNLTFSIFSPFHSEELYLYAEGPCNGAGKSLRKILVNFLNCTCPVGFQPKRTEENTNCECVCDSQLYPYIIDPNCDPHTGTVLRTGNFWVSYINNVDNSSGYKYLIYPHCPFDYCLPHTSNIYINLNLVDGADVQCANNRSGILCCSCQPGLSLSLGSSQCILCSKAWHKDVTAILIAAFLSGIALVASILILNLTVAVGTLNGLIFYANIVGATRNSFFHSSKVRLFSVFISWLNLEVGFDTCFYEGMDTYWKTWLQLAFPTYIILLVVMVIVVSEHSMRFSRLIAKGNPVATLATLILLSYTKLLRTVITSLSFATVYYPDGSHRTLWLPDANVEYLSGKHTALFILAILILLVAIGYTFLLFFWQWLLRHQDKIVLKWVNYQRLCHFIEPYHAPYITKHRYWTGLLLFARVTLYLVFALNVSGDPGVNLLAIILVTSSLIFLKGFFGKIYKNWVVEIVEMICYLNIALFNATILYTLEAGRSHTFTAYISGSITFALFLVVLIYHVFTEMLLKLWKKYSQKGMDNGMENGVQLPIVIDSDKTDQPEPTFSVIDVFLHGEKSKEHSKSNTFQFKNESADEDRASTVSANSMDPLLDEDAG